MGSIYRVGNYDYSVNWIFHQDGTLEAQVEATGFMETRNVERKSDADPAHDMTMGGSVGTLVAPNVTAPNHQHFFNFRLDMDVDGATNVLHEMNVEPVPAGANKMGNGFAMKETVLRTEKAAERSVNGPTARRWAVVNTSVKNALGQNSSYVLMPGENRCHTAAGLVSEHGRRLRSAPSLGHAVRGNGDLRRRHLRSRWASDRRAREMDGGGPVDRQPDPCSGTRSESRTCRVSKTGRS